MSEVKPVVYDLKSAEKALGISERSIRKLLDEDPSFPRIHIGRRVLIPIRALEEWVNQRVHEERATERRVVSALSKAVGR